ncbi:MAG: peptidoglycan editing factor PgeF [Gemella sp.]|nr:peptidoglycan editing factor PgeF [Gemella sp.]
MIKENKKVYIYENETVKFLFTKKDVDAKDFQAMNELLGEYDFNYEKLSYAKQVHGCDVISIEDKLSDFSIESDALVTNEIKKPLMIFTADCVPLVFYDEVNKVVGLAHAGWKGTYSEIAKNTLKVMADKYESNVENIKVFIGPHISADVYKVSKELIEKFADLKIDNYYKEENGEYYLNLEEINKQILIRNGIAEGNISVSGLCTVKDNDKFYSFRQDKGTEKRIATVIELK